MTTALTLLALAWGLAAALQLGLWLVQQRTGNAGIVDVGWAGAFTLVVVAFVVASPRPAAATWPVAAMVAAWSLRLTTYLVRRGAASGPEEGRYRDLRARWSKGAGGASRAFFVFFQAQAALVALLSVAFVWPFVAAPVWPAAQLAGAAVWAGGLVGEAVSDAQLARFKRDPARRGQVCDVGLWGWSRHPNYFFEVMVWVGYALYAAAFPWGGLAALGPAVILFSILRVTGLPATEAQALRSKGDLYRAYQARVSAFIPWPPRSSRPSR